MQLLNCSNRSETHLKILAVLESRQNDGVGTQMAQVISLIKCSHCHDGGWVCVLHRDRPWDGSQACRCGLAGLPCPTCNAVSGDQLPRMPKDFRATEISNEPFVLQR
jgi:hypothetical protein